MPRSKKQLNEWLDSIGVKLDTEKLDEVPIEKEPHTQQMAKWEAQSLLISLTWPLPEMVAQKCLGPYCDQTFLTNYRANRYCSMQCHKDALLKMGIAWRPERTFAEQWGNLEPPLMIPPNAIKAMRRLLNLVDQGMIGQTDNPEPETVDIPEETEADEALPDLPIPDNDPETQSEPQTIEDEDEDFLAELDAL